MAAQSAQAGGTVFDSHIQIWLPMHWRGEFSFGDVWLAFRGQTADNRVHAHAAVQLVSAPSPIKVVDDGGREFVGRAWVIRSGAHHCLHPAPTLTLVLCDPQSRLAAAVLSMLEGGSIVPLPDGLARTLSDSPVLRDAVLRMEQEVISTSSPPDVRLARALEHLETQTSGDPVTAASLHSGLSPSRLRALAQAQFGVPFSKLVLWKKVRMACLAMARGASLVDASLEAGFADQAHLTRTMADVIGLTPGEARSAAS